jgi:PRC-barrel domain protein
VRLELGAAVRTADGDARVLADVVVDAGAKRVTHVVVEPDGEHEAARLVAFELVRAGPDGLALTCTTEALEGMEAIRGYAYVPEQGAPVDDEKWSVGVEDVIVAPTYDTVGLGEPELDPNVSVLYDRVPKGEVELRGSSDVYSSDEHHLGTVRAVDVDDGGRIGSLAFRRGRLWWKRELAIPADAIASLETDVVTLGLDKDGLGNLTSA